MNKSLQQFDVVQVDLNPTQGVEQEGLRPCVILQTNAVNTVARTFLIAPLTSKKLNRLYYCQVQIQKSRQNGLTLDSKLKLEQIRVVDGSRILKKMGTLEPFYHSLIFQSIDLIFDRARDFR